MTQILVPSYNPEMDKKYVVEPGTGCWVWQRSFSSTGYGNGYFNGKAMTAHKEMWLRSGRAVPEVGGWHFDHLCKRRVCCNPDHLEIVTIRVNVIERSDSPAAKNSRKTECPSGHPYDAENTRITTRGWRLCKACQREYANRRYAQKKAGVR